MNPDYFGSQANIQSNANRTAAGQSNAKEPLTLVTKFGKTYKICLINFSGTCVYTECDSLYRDGNTYYMCLNGTLTGVLNQIGGWHLTDKNPL